MSPAMPALKGETVERRQSALRLVPGERAGGPPSPIAPGAAAPAAVPPAAAKTAEVLLAGANPARLAALRAELDASLPRPASFAEADSLAAVLERAPTSRVVILDGDLEDTDAGALMEMLGRRYPELPVMRLDEPEPAATTAAWERG